MQARPIKNVVFDLGGVLIEWQPMRFIKGIFSDRESPPVEFVEVLSSPLWKDLDRGTITKEEAIALLPERKLLDGCLPYLTPIAAGVNILKEVRQKGLRTYVLSNYHDDYFDGIYRKYYDTEVCFKDFDGLTISSRVKCIKPEPDIYEHLLHDHKLLPDETLFIDDVEANVEAARSAGLLGIVCKDYNQLRKDLEDLHIL